MLFKLFKIRRMITDAKANPAQFAGSEVRDTLIELVIVPFIILILLLGLFFLLGFTEILGGPFFIGRLFFYIFLIGGSAISWVVWKLMKLAKHLTERTVSDTIHVESTSVERKIE